jgi:DNA-binding MarR family transcriptional regulator
MAEAPTSNYFGTFLETVKSKEQEPEAGSAPIEMITVLQERGPLDVRELQAAVHLDIVSFSKALETLSEAQLIRLEGVAGDEKASLTAHGHRLAELQLPVAS